jgi:MSHA pilin protein MshA
MKLYDGVLYKMRGFTLIELIVVIIIIAVLSAVIMPRLNSLPVDARIAKLKTVRGSVASASMLVHAMLFARNNSADNAICPASGEIANNSITGEGTLCIEGGIINVINGYPAVTDFGIAGILSATGLTTVFNPTQSELQVEGFDYNKQDSTALFQVIGGSNAKECSFSYTEAMVNASPIISAVITTGC